MLGVHGWVYGEQREDSCEGGREDEQNLDGWADGRVRLRDDRQLSTSYIPLSTRPEAKWIWQEESH